MADKLLQAGFAGTGEQLLTHCIDDALSGLDDDAGTLINLVMVPGQLSCAVPIDVLIRALNSGTQHVSIDTIAKMFQGLDLFRWRMGESSRGLIGFAPFNIRSRSNLSAPDDECQI